MKRIVDMNEAHFCDGLSCYDCSLWDLDNQKCKVLMWFDEQPEYVEKEKIVPVATIAFDKKQIEESIDIALSQLYVVCDKCGNHVTLKKKGGEEV